MNLACNIETLPFTDNEASRWKANKTKHLKEKQKHRTDSKEAEESEVAKTTVGMHQPGNITQASGIRSGWGCKVCRFISATKARLSSIAG